MAKSYIESTSVVWIAVWGEIVPTLRQFVREQEIAPEVIAGGEGPSSFAHGYSPVDAAIIQDWLKEHGVTEPRPD